MTLLGIDSVAPAAAAARVTRNANLIARNLQCHGAAAAAAETADHIRLFWAPGLRSILLEQAEAHPELFSPIASSAIAKLGEQRTQDPGIRRFPNASRSAVDLAHEGS